MVLNGQQRTELSEKRLKDLKVKNYLFAAIDKTILKQILQKNSSKELWDSMKAKFQGNERVQSAQLQRMRREFEILEMKNGESVTEYFSRVMIVANDMRNLGEDMPDSKVVEKVLRTLSERFTYIVCAIEESKDIKHLSIDELQSSLLVHEQKFKKKENEEHVLHVAGEPRRGQQWTRGRGGFRGAVRSRGGRGRGSGMGVVNKALIECYNCHKLGHYQYECPNLEDNANYAEFDEAQDMLLMAYTEVEKKEKVWFLTPGVVTICAERKNGSAILMKTTSIMLNLEITQRWLSWEEET